MSAELCCVDPAQVASIWPRISHFIERAMERGGMGRFEDVERDVLSANAYLWLDTAHGIEVAERVNRLRFGCGVEQPRHV